MHDAAASNGHGVLNTQSGVAHDLVGRHRATGRTFGPQW